jgi:FMN phosphatase YigB (HAD superfamily)/DNA-binding XRE family transcriptional regulator
MDEVSLGEALQAARKKAGLTQQELCDKAGLSYSTLAKIERGAIKAPSVFTIHKVAQILGVTLNDLLPALPAPAKAVSKNGVRFIYFDVNGCLVRFYHRAFTKIAEDSGKQADVVETAFWHYNDAVCRGDIGMEEFNRDLGQQLGLPNFDWLRYYLEVTEPIQAMHELVTWAAGVYEVGLLTNIMPGQVDAMMDRGLIPKLDYAAVIDSSEVKAIKPEPHIYQVAAVMAGCQPSEILLVDDSRANIMAAERDGWNVMWFDDYRPEECAERVRAALEPAS